MQRNRGDVLLGVHQLAELLPVAPDSLQSLLLELRELAGLELGWPIMTSWMEENLKYFTTMEGRTAMLAFAGSLRSLYPIGFSHC